LKEKEVEKMTCREKEKERGGRKSEKEDKRGRDKP
jgi:hypothetical protein